MTNSPRASLPHTGKKPALSPPGFISAPGEGLCLCADGDGGTGQPPRANSRGASPGTGPSCSHPMHSHLSQCPQALRFWGCLPRQSSWVGSHAALVPHEGFGPPSLFSHFLLHTPVPPPSSLPDPQSSGSGRSSPSATPGLACSPISAVPVAQAGPPAASSFLRPPPHVSVFSLRVYLGPLFAASLFSSPPCPSHPVAGMWASWALSLWALAVSALPTWLGRSPRHLFPCPLAGPHEALRQHLWSQRWASARGTAVIPRRQGRESWTSGHVCACPLEGLMALAPSARASGRSPFPGSQPTAPRASYFSPPRTAGGRVTLGPWQVLNFSFLFSRAGPTGLALADVRRGCQCTGWTRGTVPSTESCHCDCNFPGSPEPRWMDGGGAEPLLFEVSHVHFASLPLLDRKDPHTHLGSSCPQSQPDYTP